jgi:hypothetical protein
LKREGHSQLLGVRALVLALTEAIYSVSDLEPVGGIIVGNARTELGTAGAVARHHEPFPAFEHVYLLTYVQLADAKAAVFLAMATSAIAYLAARYGLMWLKFTDTSLHIALLALTSALLAISAAHALAVIVPRLPETKASVIYFQAIAHSSNQQYVNDVLARKYPLLHRSLAIGILGYVAFIATVILL